MRQIDFRIKSGLHAEYKKIKYKRVGAFTLHEGQLYD